MRQFERELLARGIDRIDLSGLPTERIALKCRGKRWKRSVYRGRHWRTDRTAGA
ncbi:hypothetical protein [Chromatium okenii]|uniref:hypothetical protein n=1 Tax=Chromatium okenii TaxID=61644 RepID=UPI001F5BCE9E|nr:hypothetical protein [Chromatium okenii]